MEKDDSSKKEQERLEVMKEQKVKIESHKVNLLEVVATESRAFH